MDSEHKDPPERRSGNDRRTRERRVVDIPPAVYGKKERRSGKDRRKGGERRKRPPRKSEDERSE